MIETKKGHEMTNTAAKNAIALPEGFISVEAGLPDHDRPVLAIRKSGYITCQFEILTARYMLTYRPNSPWRDISNDAVSDTGDQILGWREMPEWFDPEQR